MYAQHIQYVAYKIIHLTGLPLRMNEMKKKMPSDHACFDLLSSETHTKHRVGARGFALVFNALPYTVPLVKI